MPARIQEALIGWGFKKQTNISTANILSGIWRLGKLNAEIKRPKLMTESDAEELGKGHEFASQSFKSHWDASGRIEKFTSSDFAAWAWAFALGKVVQSGTPPNHVYTCTPAVPAADGIELPYFSVLEQIRPGASDVIDYMLVGCMISALKQTLSSGPGRASSKLEVDYVGSGKFTEPSAITLPAATVEKLLSSASLALTINGVNYVSTKNISEVEINWNNNPLLDEGFYPGSGAQSGAAIRGRIEYGARTAGLRFAARFEDGSTELTKITDQTEGTAVLSLTFDANNDLTITFHRIQFSESEFDAPSGLLRANVTCLPMYHTANGLVTVVAKCNTDLIAQ